jgi:hypothetical protein
MRRVDQGLKRSSDTESLSLRQLDASVKDVTVDADDPIANFLKNMVTIAIKDRKLNSLLRETLGLGQFSRLLSFRGNTG